MPKQVNIQFSKLVEDVYDSVLREFGFQIHEEGKYIVIARKTDIELIFRLEATVLFYDLSLEIKLLGKLGERATPVIPYRHLGVLAIAKCLDTDYKMRLKKAQTETEVREILIADKEILLKYCKEIMLGDISVWQKVVECLDQRRTSQDSSALY